MGDFVKGMFGIETKSQKNARRAAVEANNQQIRAANVAAEIRQKEAADLVDFRRKRGKAMLKFNPLGGARGTLGAR